MSAIVSHFRSPSEPRRPAPDDSLPGLIYLRSETTSHVPCTDMTGTSGGQSDVTDLAADPFDKPSRWPLSQTPLCPVWLQRAGLIETLGEVPDVTTNASNLSVGRRQLNQPRSPRHMMADSDFYSDRRVLSSLQDTQNLVTLHLLWESCPRGFSGNIHDPSENILWNIPFVPSTTEVCLNTINHHLWTRSSGVDDRRRQGTNRPRFWRWQWQCLRRLIK